MGITRSTEHRREPVGFAICGSAIFAGESDDGSPGTTPITLAKTIPNGRKLSLIHHDDPARAGEPPYWAPGWPEDWADGLPELFPFGGERLA